MTSTHLFAKVKLFFAGLFRFASNKTRNPFGRVLFTGADKKKKDGLVRGMTSVQPRVHGCFISQRLIKAKWLFTSSVLIRGEGKAVYRASGWQVKTGLYKGGRMMRLQERVSAGQLFFHRSERGNREGCFAGPEAFQPQHDKQSSC